MTWEVFDVKKQLAFYASYHRNPINVGIHIVCVPLILWTSLTFFSHLQIPGVKHVYHEITPWLAFETTWATVGAAAFQLYYFALEPLGALLYLPQMLLTILTATAFVHNVPNSTPIAIALFTFSWIAQFAGHGLAEGRAPALLDNLMGALVLAPFFVHLEILFPLGFKPELHKMINNLAAVELARVRKIEGDKKRAAAAAAGGANESTGLLE